MNRVDATLLFHKPTPQTVLEADGYRLCWSGAKLMGILNVTPDSFSDGGQHLLVDEAVAHAKAMRAAGALIIDIGGESTRPGAEPVDVSDELDRVLPVIRRLREETDAIISIDSAKPEVVAEALTAGAHLVNDVRGLRDAAMMRLCAEQGLPVVIMHMQGEPRTMQQQPHYEDVSAEVFGFLLQQSKAALSAGVPSVVLDPGIGFGKTVAHNLQLIRNLSQLVSAGHPVLLGASRKRFIGTLVGEEDATERDPGSVALHLYAAQQGAALLRVHNVPMHQQALEVWESLDEAR